MKKTNRSYIVTSVISKNGSWNSDFNHKPKKYKDAATHENVYFASDRVLKHAVRHLFECMGEEVFIKKWNELKDGALIVKNDAEIKKEIQELNGGKTIQEVFWNFADIRQFGMLYDGLGIHGVAQVSQGIDKYKMGKEYDDDLISKMVFGKSASKKAKQEDDSVNLEVTKAMNAREFLTEAHYLYEVTVNPANIAFFEEIEEFKNNHYTQEDYEKLIFALTNGPRSVKSTQKMNCFTGLLIQIDLAEESKLHLADLQSKVEVVVDETTGKATYDINNLVEYALERAKGQQDVFEKFILKFDKYALDIQDIDALLEKYSFIQLEEL